MRPKLEENLITNLRPFFNKLDLNFYCYSKRSQTNDYGQQQLLLLLLFIITLLILIPFEVSPSEVNQTARLPVMSNENFTFTRNGSFLQLDAGKEWPFNSKREISFRFRTKSPHGLLIYQTFDHSKLAREEPEEGLDGLSVPPPLVVPPAPPQASPPTIGQKQQQVSSAFELGGGGSSSYLRSHQMFATDQAIIKLKAGSRSIRSATMNRVDNDGGSQQLTSSTITATASEKLVNSLFSSSPAAAINGNNNNQRSSRGSQFSGRDGSNHHRNMINVNLKDNIKESASPSQTRIVAGGSSGGSGSGGSLGVGGQLRNTATQHGVTSGGGGGGGGGGGQSMANQQHQDGSTILSSSAISTFSASIYELYIRLENGRLKIMFEFGSRLNQTYCGKGLNDDKWHRVDLRVDPELNQMSLVLDQMVTVEIALSPQLVTEDELSSRRNELVFTNSVLYMGGLDNNASLVRNIKQRLYMAQFIGCIGQIMLKTDQHTESSLQPAPIARQVLVKRGCLDRCETDNYCLHKSTCINYYTTTKCDCFGTQHEDLYCWQDQLTTLSMLGYSTLVYRIYDWRDRHHSSTTRLSMQFKTLALDSILFYAYGDLSSPSQHQNHQKQSTISSLLVPPASGYLPPTMLTAPMNISQLPQIHRVQQQSSATPPLMTTLSSTQTTTTTNSNYLAVSLSNGTIVVEINFGDQPILLSNYLYDNVYNRTSHLSNSNPTSNYYRPLTLSDGRWHNLTFVHHQKHLSLYIDNYSVNYTILGKNVHLYFDPSIYIGAVPNLLSNETRTLMRPFNLRHKFVGCLRSVYFNQHDILLALKQNSPMVEYRDVLGRPRLNTCLVREPSSLPLTMRSGKSYLTFQLTSSSSQLAAPLPTTTQKLEQLMSQKLIQTTDSTSSNKSNSLSEPPIRKLTKIEFEYRTPLKSHFLAGGHLRDSSYHDLGGFWTLHAKDDCQLYFTISSGLTFEPEQIIRLTTTKSDINTNDVEGCDSKSWFKISISMVSGDKVLNITRTKSTTIQEFEDEYLPSSSSGDDNEYQSFTLRSSVELLHQVQIGGDLAKFGESSSVPFAGCLRRIKINGHLFDSRDFVTNSASIMPLMATNFNQSSGTSSAIAATPLGPTQSDLISSRMAQGYVTLDSCQLVNHCASLNPCKNNGTCKINELGEPECDCSKTGYTGRRCHFSNYKQSCQDLFLSGQRKSSHYLIDLDRNGPLKPIRVRCNMDAEVGGHIETILSHNLPPEFLIRGSTTRDIQIDITYLAFYHQYTQDGNYVHNEHDEQAKSDQDLMLRALIGQSLYCRQYIRYECRSAPLELGNRTWMVAPYPRSHKLTSLDGINHGKCMCATTEKRCLNPIKNCNCDSNESIWTDDSYDLIGHEDVGLTKIIQLRQQQQQGQQEQPRQQQQEQLVGSSLTDSIDRQQQGSVESQSRFTLSDLKCFGTKKHESQHEITFKTSDAYIEVPGWRRGDISFSFRTASNPPAIILYQLATSRNHGYFRMTLVSDTRLLFEFIVNRRPRKLYLTSMHKLNNGEWQQVFIEYDSVNLRLTVNDDSAFVDLDTNDYLGTFEGPLFIGGAPGKYLVGDLSKRNGFTGCFRGLNINGASIDLKSYLSPSMPTVTSACRPSCSKNLCQNGGKCIEYWGSYECECSNPLAHSGSNCEINLNTNSITFVTQESYYVQVLNDSLLYPSYLIKNILLNIRTYQETALILYASDHLNNFIQLHKNGSSLVLTFNSNSTIVVSQMPIDEEQNLDIAISNAGSNLIQSSIITEASQFLPTSSNVSGLNSDQQQQQNKTLTAQMGAGLKSPTTATSMASLNDRSIRISNTSGSGQPIQVKIERHRLRTTFYVNNNFMVVEKPILFLTNYTQNPWSNPELELVRPPRPKMGSKTYFQIFLANIDEYFSTRLPGFTGCIQGLSIDNQLFDFNRAHLTGELKGEYRIGCKMHCDWFPCKNHGTCIENWKEDKIQCKCDATSYVGRLCDEDIAAIFNGRSSYFIYHLSKKYRNPKIAQQKLASFSANSTTLESPNQPVAVEFGQAINFFEISLAFSTDASNQSSSNYTTGAVQALVLITRTNSSKHFFLGLTADGSLLVQEDYGNSMSLSRLIKKPDQPYNDGHRHMVKYSRYNQTIQIIVDYQTYLPTMSVITANQINRYSRSSMIMVGGTIDQQQQPHQESSDTRFSNYSGCISNLVIKMDDITIEPLSDAFGQNFESLNTSAIKGDSKSSLKPSLKSVNSETTSTAYDQQLETKKTPVQPLDDSIKLSSAPEDFFARLVASSDTLGNPINSNSNNGDEMETIVAHDVEQGKCSSFKRIEVINEKRSINEPKYTPLLEPRPIYMDPPRIKSYKRNEVSIGQDKLSLHQFGLLFYCSLTFLALASTSCLIYAYILQVRYNSEKFRCETPFFHKRDEQPLTTIEDGSSSNNS